MTTTEYSWTQLRAYERCVAALMADPDVFGDLLLIGLYMARYKHLGKGSVPGTKFGEVAQTVFGHSAAHRRVRRALEADMPPRNEDGTWAVGRRGRLAYHLPNRKGWPRVWGQLAGQEPVHPAPAKQEKPKRHLHAV